MLSMEIICSPARKIEEVFRVISGLNADFTDLAAG